MDIFPQTMMTRCNGRSSQILQSLKNIFFKNKIKKTAVRMFLITAANFSLFVPPLFESCENATVEFIF